MAWLTTGDTSLPNLYRWCHGPVRRDLLMDGALVTGDITSTGADWVEITSTTVAGGVTITGTTRWLVFEDNVLRGGPVRIEDKPAAD